MPTCSVEGVVVQGDGAEGELHGPTCDSLVDHCTTHTQTHTHEKKHSVSKQNQNTYQYVISLQYKGNYRNTHEKRL